MPLNRVLSVCALGVVLLTAFWIHSPSLSLGFVSDDFQWWQHSRMALDDPHLLLAAYGGYRPVNTWTLALDHLLFGTDPFGYHLTNILLHLATGIVLWMLLRRFSIPWATRTPCVLLWLCSPYTLEPAQFVANRFDLILLCCWMGLALLWPAPEQRWSRARIVGALALSILTVLSKESWIVLPGFVFVFEILISKRSFRRSVAHAALITLAVPVYVALYFRHPTIDAHSYYDGGFGAVAKIPHAWAVFLSLATLKPTDFPIGAPEIIGLVIMAVMGWGAWRWRVTLAGIGAVIFVLPFIPVLTVNFMPTRYTALPLAGFLMIIASLLHAVPHGIKPRWRIATVAGFAAFAILSMTVNLVWLRGDFVDARRLSDMTGELVGEFRSFTPNMPRTSTLVVVRLERYNPLGLIAGDTRGVSKIFYVRGMDPYGLADWPALISYCLDPIGGPIFVDAADHGSAATDYAVIGHDRGGFRLLPAGQRTASEAARSWERMGYPTRVVEPWSKDPRSLSAAEAARGR